MDRPKCQLIRDVLNEQLSTVADGLGVSFEIGNARYDDSQVTFKLTALDRAADGTVVSQAEKDWNDYAVMYGFEVEDFGRAFESNRTEYKICGIKPKSRKYPILGKRWDGKQFKFRAEDVLRSMKRLALQD